MRIAVNTRLLLSGKMDGIGWFSYETLKRITQQHPEHEFFFIFDREPSKEFIFADNVTPIVTHPQARHPILYYLYFEWGIPPVLKKIKPDLFLSPDGWLSLSTKVNSMAVIHDLNFVHNPEYLPWSYRKYYLHYFPKFARKAKRIATVSEYTKQDIVEQYKISPDKIDVVYNGANDKYKPVGEDIKVQVRKKYTHGSPYFVFVGTLHPRKNLANLFKAFGQFKQEAPTDVKLLIVGDKKWWTGDIKEAYDGLNCKDDVIFAGRLATEELHKVVASALAMTYVSLFEGFGIPIVESYFCGVPVITSNVTSMPEVAGDAALLVDPFSVKSISDAMLKMATDDKLRKELALKGIERGKKFSWQQSADRLWGSIEKVL
jgi:glycosyltransferase involved in cell wall biosynthesis